MTIVCDLHSAAGEEVPATEHSIEIDGLRKSADLCADCFDRYVAPLKAALELLGEAQTQAEPERARGAPPTPKKSRSRKKKPAKKVDNAAVRAWAREQGIELSPRGRVPRAVVDQYRAAH